MEKFLLLRLACILLLLPSMVNAQEYAVFKTTGTPNLSEGSNTLPISKGILLKTGKVELKNDDTLILINNFGEVFEIDSPGSYAVIDFENHKKESSKENFSSQYFSYVWKQINKKEATQNHTGNVYRDALIDVLVTPLDSTSIFKNDVTFSWQSNKKDEQYYFFLKNNETNTVSKIKVGCNSLTLYVGSNLLEKGNTYYWGVATTEYPDFTRIKMNQLNYLNSEQFETKKEEFNELTESLTEIGLTKTEISEQLCQYNKFCLN
ncbi:hypothetical protein Aeqsu_0381 [Aequorivita sublithincola DSM 14238]|uniref:Uncharacterized protein n=1 Tax=Aequorivita sublithincola (strain DSM 14238 / LMG 21431 / ACAM 643 / 9-3) TaxID=746697 RepID=I3YSC6_AEQSU|nr:hypothetical protein [Aequorivita sublithincola]AFL79894.1 hypothetical protein Aeqsu_0381 [Aequorivita sublithincola DSM 14238]